MKRNRSRVMRNNRPHGDNQQGFQHNHHDERPRHQHNRPYLQQQHDKHLNAARDAMSMGDRVAAENSFQHADHFLRLLNECRDLKPQQDTRRHHDGKPSESHAPRHKTDDSRNESAPIAQITDKNSDEGVQAVQSDMPKETVIKPVKRTVRRKPPVEALASEA
jgi:hypothetical protein